jgi:hypothetical protein
VVAPGSAVVTMTSVRVRTMKAAAALAVLLGAAVAQAAGPVLRVERIDASQYPVLRAYVTLVGSSGTPITGLAKENFKVFELKENQVKPTKVQSLDTSQYGAAVAVVVQVSGTMTPVIDDIKKAAAGFINGLSDQDKASVIVYSDKVEVLAPMGEKAQAASAVNRIENPGYTRLLFDGVAAAFNQFAAPTLPFARAVVVFGDGGDSGSTADLARLVADAKRKQLPVYTIGHSQVGGSDLDTLRDLAKGVMGDDWAYVEAQMPDEFAKAFTRVQQLIGKQYVVEWKADDIASDEKTYPVDIAVEVGETKLRGGGEVKTPLIKNYTKLIVILVSVLLLAAIGVLVYIKTRPEPPPIVHCPVCRQQQMPEWDTCLFCMKNAKAFLVATKGPATGKKWPLVGKVVKIGKGPENMIKLPDPSVSTSHCSIGVDGTKFEVVDLNSSNGTFVSGKRTQRRFLRNGDVLTLGQTELKFESTVVDADGGDYSE